MTDESPADGVEFSDVWRAYTEENLSKTADLAVEDGFGKDEWELFGYQPPERRSENEAYSWSKFYDFWWWLYTNDYIVAPDGGTEADGSATDDVETDSGEDGTICASNRVCPGCGTPSDAVDVGFGATADIETRTLRGDPEDHRFRCTIPYSECSVVTFTGSS